MAALRVQDLACPTWGLGKSTSADGKVITTIGSPFLPLVVPGTQFFSLNPTWASYCTGLLAPMGRNMQTFALFDPPQILTVESRMLADPAATLVPATTRAGPTTASVQVTPLAGPAKPAPRPIDLQAPPANTRTPVAGNEASPPSSGSRDSLIPASVAGGPTASHTQESDPPSEPIPSSGAFGSSSDDPGDLPGYAQNPQPTKEGENPDIHVQGLGGIIYSAFGKVEPEAGGSPNDIDITTSSSPNLQQAHIAGSPALTFNPSKTEFAWITPTIGEPAIDPPEGDSRPIEQPQPNVIVINGDPNNAAKASSGVDGNLAVAGLQNAAPKGLGNVEGGSNPLPDGNQPSLTDNPNSLQGPTGSLIGFSSIVQPAQPIINIGSQAFPANPTGFSLDNAEISPGGPARTVDDTPINLDQSGVLAIGSATITLPASASAVPIDSMIVVAGQTLTPNPSAFSVAGTTISAGGPAVTIGGIAMSLQSFGTLVVGSSTLALQPSPTPMTTTDTISLQAHPSLAITGGVTVSPSATETTVAGSVVSLQSAATTLDLGTGRFAKPNSTASVSAVQGGQDNAVEISFLLVVGTWISLVLVY